MANTPIEVLDNPLTIAQLKALAKADENGYVSGVIRMGTSDLIDNDLEGVLDIMSERLTGSGVLSDIGYSVVGIEGDDTLLMKVTGDPALILEANGDGDENEAAQV